LLFFATGSRGKLQQPEADTTSHPDAAAETIADTHPPTCESDTDPTAAETVTEPIVVEATESHTFAVA
jgi:hypothetical protein